jgi:hypothetical protein
VVRKNLEETFFLLKIVSRRSERSDAGEFEFLLGSERGGVQRFFGSQARL